MNIFIAILKVMLLSEFFFPSVATVIKTEFSQCRTGALSYKSLIRPATHNCDERTPRLLTMAKKVQTTKDSKLCGGGEHYP